MMSLMRVVLSATLLCCALGDGSKFLGKARATSTATEANSTYTETTAPAATSTGATWDAFAGAVADQVSSWEQIFRNDTSKAVAMKAWSNITAGIVTDYLNGHPLSIAMNIEAAKHLPQVAKFVAGSPLLAFGATVFVSLFGESEAEKLAALDKQLMAEVQGEIVSDKLNFWHESAVVKQYLSEMVFEIKVYPSYAGDAPAGASASWSEERMTFWMAREANFRMFASQVFSPSCVSTATMNDPNSDESPVCKEFQAAGAIVFQVPYVLTHITILLQLAQFSLASEAQHQYLQYARTMAGTYYALLKYSLDSYAKLGAEATDKEEWQKKLHATYDGILEDIQALANAK